MTPTDKMTERDWIEFDLDMEIFCILTENSGISYDEARQLAIQERAENPNMPQLSTTQILDILNSLDQLIPNPDKSQLFNITCALANELITYDEYMDVAEYLYSRT